MRSGSGEILTRLRDQGAMSRAELSRVTGISSAGVTKIMTQMIREGLVRECDPSGAFSIGRPATTVEICPEARHVLGIHLGAGQVHIALSDAALNLSHTRSITYDLTEPVEDLIARVSDLARNVLRDGALPFNQILGIGVGVPGGVDPARRVNTHSVLTGWKGIAFAEAFEQSLGLPVVLEHNATAMAMAEACYGAGRAAESILYLLLGKGIGGGFVQTGAAERRSVVEIGHIVVEPGGRPCRCGGRGCLERFFSEEPLSALVGDPDLPRSKLVAAAMERPEWPQLYEYLLQAMSTTVTLFGPERVVLGGDFNGAPERFFADLRRDLPPRVMPQQRLKLAIERTSLDEPVGVQGAAGVALEQFLYSNGPLAAARMSYRQSARV
ncbi:MAG: sugar kinase [Martelella sp.]|uniref:ROK family transcriptional regulator n=1 Tax=unclassified Martelella TaxID=2629616 RepID=UPI000C5F4DE3|nr:ROK family transcriptional regulator [Martelella sp.]MAU22932.1 sugar kinase [Martelella sp.]